LQIAHPHCLPSSRQTNSQAAPVFHPGTVLGLGTTARSDALLCRGARRPVRHQGLSCPGERFGSSDASKAYFYVRYLQLRVIPAYIEYHTPNSRPLPESAPTPSVRWEFCQLISVPGEDHKIAYAAGCERPRKYPVSATVVVAKGWGISVNKRC